MNHFAKTLSSPNWILINVNHLEKGHYQSLVLALVPDTLGWIGRGDQGELTNHHIAINIPSKCQPIRMVSTLFWRHFSQLSVCSDWVQREDNRSIRFPLRPPLESYHGDRLPKARELQSAR